MENMSGFKLKQEEMSPRERDPSQRERQDHPQEVGQQERVVHHHHHLHHSMSCDLGNFGDNDYHRGLRRSNSSSSPPAMPFPLSSSPWSAPETRSSSGLKKTSSSTSVSSMPLEHVRGEQRNKNSGTNHHLQGIDVSAGAGGGGSGSTNLYVTLASSNSPIKALKLIICFGILMLLVSLNEVLDEYLLRSETRNYVHVIRVEPNQELSAHETQLPRIKARPQKYTPDFSDFGSTRGDGEHDESDNTNDENMGDGMLSRRGRSEMIKKALQDSALMGTKGQVAPFFNEAGECVGRWQLWQDCTTQPECCPIGTACFRKNKWFAQCREDCVRGAVDGFGDRKHAQWQCDLLSKEFPEKMLEKRKPSTLAPTMDDVQTEAFRNQLATEDVQLLFLVVHEIKLVNNVMGLVQNIRRASPGVNIRVNLVTDIKDLTSAKFLEMTGHTANVYNVHRKYETHSEYADKLEEIKFELDEAFSDPMTNKRSSLELACLYKPLLHLILPVELKRVLVLDNDLYFMRSVRDLWMEFANFGPEQAMGLAYEMNPGYHGCWNDTKSRQVHNKNVGFQGLNGGIQLLDLEKMRHGEYMQVLLGPYDRDGIQMTLSEWVRMQEHETTWNAANFWRKQRWSVSKFNDTDGFINDFRGLFTKANWFYIETAWEKCAMLASKRDRAKCRSAISICPIRLTNFAWWWGDQTWHSVVASVFPQLYYVLPCGYNFQLCTHYNALFHNWHEAYSCPVEQARVLHANCMLKMELYALLGSDVDPSRVQQLWLKDKESIVSKAHYGPIWAQRFTNSDDPEAVFAPELYTGADSTFGNMTLFKFIRENVLDTEISS